MKTYRFLASVALAVILVAPSIGIAQTVKDRYIVVLEPGVSNPVALANTHGVNPSNVYRSVFKGFAATIPEAALKGRALFLPSG